jgi:hypothetical protein
MNTPAGSRLFWLFVLSLLLFPKPDQARAQAPVYESITADEVAGLLEDMGLPYTLDTDSYGDPRLSFELAAYSVALYFYTCEDGRCSSLQLYGGFEMDTPPSLEEINGWNGTKRFARAYIDDEGDPVLESDLDLAGGVSAEVVQDFVHTFQSLLTEYAHFVGFE